MYSENSETRQDTHETISMGSQDSLEVPHASEFSHSLDSENEATRGMVVKPSKHPMWRILTPQGSRHIDLYRRIKRRLGCTVRSRFHRRFMVSGRKTTTHKRARPKSSNPNPSTLFKTVHQETGVSSLRQHHCSSPHKQNREEPTQPNFAPSVETWCNKYQITLRVRHVPGSLNEIADGLSRRNQIQYTEWSLSLQIFKQITQLWEHPQIDLFTTSLNKKLPTYVSPIPDPQAWAVVH